MTSATSGLLIEVMRPPSLIDPAALRDFATEIGDWSQVMQVAVSHGALVLLATRLEELAGFKVPGQVEGRVREERIRSLGLIREMSSAIELLHEHGIIAVPFKGPELSERLYGDASLRQSVDVDLLVARADALRARGILERAGYRFWLSGLTRGQEQGLLSYSNEYGLWSPDGTIIELSWAMAPRHFVWGVDADEFLASLAYRRFAGADVAVLPPESLLLALLLHGSKHGWERLIWVSDVAHLVANEEQLDWDLVADWAVSRRMTRIIGSGLYVAHVLTGVEVPPALPTTKSVAAAGERAIASIRGSPPRRKTGGRAHPLRAANLRLLDRPSDRVRHVLRLMLSPTAGDWMWVRLPDRLGFLYYGVRPIRLARDAIARGRTGQN